ncbi:YjcZ family sporulation protein [Paenibacillus jiagnxiensis]
MKIKGVGYAGAGLYPGYGFGYGGLGSVGAILILLILLAIISRTWLLF